MGEPQRNGRNSHRRSQDELIAAMMNPGFYPKTSPQVAHKETDISHIFLSTIWFTKLKKRCAILF
jgi:hypothetical protein